MNILPYCYPTASRLRFEPGPFCACHRLSPGWLGSRVVSVLYMYSQSIGSQTGKVLSTLAANEESSQFFKKWSRLDEHTLHADTTPLHTVGSTENAGIQKRGTNCKGGKCGTDPQFVGQTSR